MDLPHPLDAPLQVPHPPLRVKQRLRHPLLLDLSPQLPQRPHVFEAIHDELLTPQRVDERGRYPARHLLLRSRDDRRPRPEDVASCGVRVALVGIQEEIRADTAPDVFALVRHVREDDAVICDAPGSRLLPDTCLPRHGEAKEPQNSLRQVVEEATPNVQHEGVDLVQLVEVAQDDLVLGDSVLRPAGPAAGVEDLQGGLLVIVDEVGVRHVNQLLCVQTLQRQGADDGIRDKKERSRHQRMRGEREEKITGGGGAGWRRQREAEKKAVRMKECDRSKMEVALTCTGEGWKAKISFRAPFV
eukprot:748378-Hanusia_phi.AAC.5